MDVNMVPLGTEVNQVLQTKHALYDAFTQLLDSRAYNDITVGQICKKANFSRAVFYNHYHNKNEFLQEIFNRIIALYHKKIDHAERKGTLTEEFIHTTFLGILQEYKKFFLLLDDIRRLDMLEHFLEHAASAGFTVKDITFSPIKGPEGNIEYLGYLQAGTGPACAVDLKTLVEQSHNIWKEEGP